MAGRGIKNVGWVLLLCSVVLAGCVARNAPPVNHFSLLNVEQLGGYTPLSQQTDAYVGIGPITLVESLRRSQIVTRTSSNVYSFDEYNKWAGPLEKDVALNLGESISFFTGARGIDYFPWMSYFRPTHRVVLYVERFDGQLGKEAVLHARWNLLSGDGKTALASKSFRKTQSITGSSYGDLIRAESMLLAELGREISQSVIK